MITYNGQYIYEVKYNTNTVRQIYRNEHCIFQSPKACGLMYFNASQVGTLTSYGFGFVTTCSCKFTVEARNKSNSWVSIGTIVHGWESIRANIYEPLYEITSNDVFYSFPEGPCKANIPKQMYDVEFEHDALKYSIYRADNNELLYSAIVERPLTWTTTSVTCTCNPTTISTNQSDETNTWTVSGTAYKTQTSNIGTTRNVGIPVQYTFTSNSVIDRLEQFARPVGSLDFKYTVWRNRNKTGLATITFTVSADGYIDTATCRISVTGGVAPTPNKYMTLNFRSAGISNVWLFNSTVSNMSLPTNTLSTYVVSGSSLKLTWSDKLTVNTNVGGQTSISEGDRFYVYYSIGGASTIGQTVGSSASYILNNGSSVTIA